ncbi:MAG: cyclic-di-AMP receptor [Caldilineales bacterium]|nr:cyclic-di-AMP receptor [Caldilineales bacterium]
MTAQLLIMIVQEEDADPLCKRLSALGFAFTRLNTIGGFLRTANTTLLMAVREEDIEQVLAIVRACCRTRTAIVNPMPWAVEPGHPSFGAALTPLEAQVGGATVFCLPLLRALHLPDERPLMPAAPNAFAPSPSESPMHLVLAIVHNDDAGAVTQALLSANYRLTRINTAGGFLRRGNVTLLVGVEPGRVDEVIGLIRANVRPRIESGTESAYGATVFVLPTTRFIHI